MPAGEISGLQRPGHRHRRLCQTASASAVKIIHTSTSHPPGWIPCASASTPCATPHVSRSPPATSPRRRCAAPGRYGRRVSHHTLADGDQATYPAHRMRPVRRIATTTSSIQATHQARRVIAFSLRLRKLWLSMVGRWAKRTWERARRCRDCHPPRHCWSVLPSRCLRQASTAGVAGENRSNEIHGRAATAGLPAASAAAPALGSRTGSDASPFGCVRE